MIAANFGDSEVDRRSSMEADAADHVRGCRPSSSGPSARVRAGVARA